MLLRTDLMETTEKLRRAESDKASLETDINSLKQQVSYGKGKLERIAG